MSWKESENPRELRRPGRVEKYYITRNNVGFAFSVAVTATYALPQTFYLPIRDYIYKSCETLIAQHPVLSVTVVGEDTQDPYFARPLEINLDDCVSFQERTLSSSASNSPGQLARDIELEELLQVQHNIPFKANAQLWRLCILTDNLNERHITVVFAYHHAIADGVSGTAFHRTFKRALYEASKTSSKKVKSIINPPHAPLLPPMENLISFPVTCSYALTTYLAAKGYLGHDRGVWRGSRVMMPQKNRIHHIVISKSATAALRDACRANGTTITAFLQTLIAQVLFTYVPRRFTKMLCCGALSNRKWMPNTITDDSMGVWVQDFGERYKRCDFEGEVFPWSEAKRSRETILKALKKKTKNSVIGMLKFVKNYHRELFMSSIGKPRRVTFELSNLGVYKDDDIQGPNIPTIERMIFSQDASVNDSAFSVSVVTGGDNCMVLTFTWQMGAIEEDLMMRVIIETRKQLDRLVVAP